VCFCVFENTFYSQLFQRTQLTRKTHSLASIFGPNSFTNFFLCTHTSKTHIAWICSDFTLKYLFLILRNLQHVSFKKCLSAKSSLGQKSKSLSREYLSGKYHCTIDPLFDWFGFVCLRTDFFCITDDSKPVKREVNGTMILPHLVFPALSI
jgi:hypothetical protein